MKQHVENDATQIQMNMPNFQQYPQLQEVPSAATQQSVNMPDSRRSSFANFPDTLSSSSFQNMFSSFGSFSENIAQPVQSNNGMRNASFVAGQGSDKSSNGAGTQNANVPPFPTTAVDAAHSTNNSVINHHLHDSGAKINSSSQQPATSQPENGTMWAMAQNNANNLSQPSQQGTYLNDNIANMQGMKSNIGNGNNPLNDSRNSMLAIQNNGLQNKIATNNQMQRSLMQHMNQFQGNNPVHMQQQMHMQFQQQMQQQMQNMQPQGPLSIPHEQAHKNLASTNVPSNSNSNGALNMAPALNEVKQTKPGMSPEEQLMRQKNLIDRLERQIAEHKGQMGVTGNKTPPPNNLSQNSTSTENSAMQTKTTTETNMYNSLDKNSAYPNNVHNQFQNLNNLQSMHQPLQSGQPQKNDEILAPHVGSNNDDKGHLNPGFLPQDVAKNNHITPMFLQNQQQQQQQQHNAGITPFSDGSARYSNIPIPSLSSNVPEEANPMSWKWQCNKDMADRKCVLFSIMKVIENVQEGNNQPPDKISVMAKRLEEFLYRSARSKEEYTDMSTLKKRLHMIACDSRIDSKSPKLPNTDSNPSSAHRQQMKNSSSMNESSKIHGGSEVNSTMSETAQRRISLLRQNNLQFEGTIDAITSQRLKNQQNTSQPKAAHGMNLPPQMDYTQHNTVSQNGTIANNSGNNSSADKTALEKMLKQNQLRKFHPAIAQLHMNLNKAASSRTKQLNPEPIGEKQRKKAVRQQQQRLMLLRHASNCKLGSKCRSKVCPQMVKLWIHMKTCRDMNCTTQHCLSSRCVLNHYRICKEEKRTASCEVCSSVMKAIQMSSQSDDPLDIQPSLEDNEWQRLTATNSQLGTTKPEALSNNSIAEESKTTKRIDENHSTLAELRAEQVKLNQQHLLLKRLQDQQEQQLLQHRLSNVSPNSEEAQKLKKQNFLLQKCQQQFLEDQKLLQQLISRRDSNLQKGKDQNGLNPLQWTALNQNAGIDGSSSSGTVDVHHGLEANSLHNADAHFTERKRRPNSQSSEFEKNPKIQRLEDTDRHVNTRVQNMGGDIVMKMLPIIESLVEHEYGWIFKTAVNPVELNLPDYFEVIEKPMDLGLVKDTLMRRGYNTIEEVAGDVRLTFNNAILYNGVESDVGRMAQGMLQFFNQRMEQVHPRAEMQIQEV